ncbi:MAG: ROK family transcriptional regulator [Chloroflexota bacterium]
MPPLILSGSNGSTIKSNNIRAILMTLLRYEGVARVRLAQMTGVSPTTITNLINELLEQGVIAEENNGQLDGRRSVGRPQTALRLVPDARFVVAIHIDVDAVYISVNNLFGQPVARRSFPLTGDSLSENVLPQITTMARDMMAESGVSTRYIIGAGVGASGLVDPYTGVNVIAPNLGWHNVPLRDELSDHLGLPVAVDNNVRAMALGEMLFGAGRAPGEGHTLAFVYSRVGVGAGFVVGGQLYRGSGAGAGEIGHTTMIPDGGELCGCGNTGCLETLVSEPAIVRAAQKLADQYPGGILAESLANGEGKLIERVFNAARAGDEMTRKLLDERAHYMGIALANLVNVLNPELIVMGGIFAQGQDVLLPAVETTMRARAFAGLGERVVLQTARPGAGSIGAAALALNMFFYQQEIPN